MFSFVFQSLISMDRDHEEDVIPPSDAKDLGYHHDCNYCNVLRWIYDPVYDKLEVQGGSDPHKIWHCSDVDSYIRCVFTMSGRRRYFWHRGNKITELHPNKDYIPSFPSAEGVFYRNHSKKGHYGTIGFGIGEGCDSDGEPYVQEIDSYVLGQQDYNKMVERCYKVASPYEVLKSGANMKALVFPVYFPVMGCQDK